MTAAGIAVPSPIFWCTFAWWEDEGGRYVCAPTRAAAKHVAATELHCDYADVRSRRVRGRDGSWAADAKGPRVLDDRDVWLLVGGGACSACGEWAPLAEFGGLCDDCRPAPQS